MFQADAESLHEKICPGLSKTKVAYEKAIKESHTKENKTSPPEDVSVGHALANSLKKKFESGEVRVSLDFYASHWPSSVLIDCLSKLACRIRFANCFS